MGVGFFKPGKQDNTNIKCDAIWENPSDVAKQHFEKWLEIVRKLVSV